MHSLIIFQSQRTDELTDLFRFLYIRLLSLRRLLMVTTKRGRRTSTHMLSGAAQSSLDEEVIQRCCTLCAETASRLIETLHENLNTLYRSSGWHSVYCKYSFFQRCAL